MLRAHFRDRPGRLWGRQEVRCHATTTGWSRPWPVCGAMVAAH